MPTIASSPIANDICGRGWRHTQPSVGGSGCRAGAGRVQACLRRHKVRVEVHLVEVLGVGDVVVAAGRGARRHVHAARPAEGVLDLDHRLRAVGEQVGDLAREDAHHAQHQVAGHAQRHRHLSGKEEARVKTGARRAAHPPARAQGGQAATPEAAGRLRRWRWGSPRCRRRAATGAGVPRGSRCARSTRGCSWRRPAPWAPSSLPCARRARSCPAGPSWPAHTGSRTWRRAGPGRALRRLARAWRAAARAGGWASAHIPHARCTCPAKTPTPPASRTEKNDGTGFKLRDHPPSSDRLLLHW